MAEPDRDALTAYLDFVDPAREPLLRSLDAAVRSAGEPLEAAVKYRLLMYALGGDFYHWVCAIGPTKRTLSLRFLYGDLLDFGPLAARPGSTTMRTLDYTTVEEVDAPAVAHLVREAVGLHPVHVARERASRRAKTEKG
jgi:hypothetical protein